MKFISSLSLPFYLLCDQEQQEGPIWLHVCIHYLFYLFLPIWYPGYDVQFIFILILGEILILYCILEILISVKWSQT